MTDAEKSQALTEIEAFDVLMNSEWFMDECENANYHSQHDWLRENKEQREEEVKA